MITQGIALFDFDGTISRGDSIIPFMIYAVQKKFAPFSCIPKAIIAYARYAFKRITAVQAKDIAMAFLRGKSKTEVDAFATQFFSDVLQKRLYQDALIELAKCRQEKLCILLVSASPDAYMLVLKDLLQVDDVIATRCARDAEDRYLGQLASENCKGFEKTLRIAEYLAAHGIEVDLAKSRSYGDSLSDLPMLELTPRPTVINASCRLRKKTAHMKHIKWR